MYSAHLFNSAPPPNIGRLQPYKEQVWERKQTHTFPSWGSKTKGSHGVLITTWKILSSSICTLEYIDIQLIGKDSRLHLNPEGVTWKWKVSTGINQHWYKQNTLWDVHTSHYNSSTLLYSQYSNIYTRELTYTALLCTITNTPYWFVHTLFYRKNSTLIDLYIHVLSFIPTPKYKVNEIILYYEQLHDRHTQCTNKNAHNQTTSIWKKWYHKWG